MESVLVEQLDVDEIYRARDDDVREGGQDAHSHKFLVIIAAWLYFSFLILLSKPTTMHEANERMDEPPPPMVD